MKQGLLALAISLVMLTAVMVNQNAAAQRDQASARSQERIEREVRHELLMLPWFGVFDYIAYKVDGDTVTLLGQVVRPSLKSGAENVVKHIEGVEHVENKSKSYRHPLWMIACASSCIAPSTARLH